MSERRGQFGEILTPAEQIAEAFHDHYERLALDFGHETRDESAKPFWKIPDNIRELMIATAEAVIEEDKG